MPDRIELSLAALDVSAAIASVYDTRAGGVAVFLGTTRGEDNSAGAPLAALEYQAYEEMALKRLRALADEARRRWAIVGVVILHRLGRVEPAQPSVLIAVSCPHRAKAFEACRWLIDQIKTTVPIWKKEIWSDGATSWVHPVP